MVAWVGILLAAVSFAEIHAVDIVDSDDYHTSTAAAVVAVGLMLAVAVALIAAPPVAVRSFDAL